MINSEIFFYLISLTSGALIGIFYFGGLYYSVNKALKISGGKLFLFLSFLIRAALALLGFYFFVSKGPLYAIIALTGFIVARQIIALKFNFKEKNVNKLEKV